MSLISLKQVNGQNWSNSANGLTADVIMHSARSKYANGLGTGSNFVFELDMNMIHSTRIINFVYIYYNIQNLMHKSTVA